MTHHPSTAESPLAWTAEEIATQISDVLAENYYEPEGELAEVDYEGPDENGNYVIWVSSPGSSRQIAVVVVEAEVTNGEPSLRVTLGD
jgi:hypothetical protein